MSRLHREAKAPSETDKKISVIIPVYNGSNFLSGAIDSVLNQTYENIEIIVINDGSDDCGATKKVCEQYSEHILYLEQKNEGVAGALNTALEFASGDFFCWLSHDDEFLPEKTEKQIAFLKKFQRNDLIVFSNYFLMDVNGKVWHESNLDIDLLRNKPGIALLRGMVNGCSLMIPMELLRKHLPFNTSLRFTQDYEMWDRLRQDAEFILMPETLIRYRIHQEQDTDVTNPKVIEENNTLWIKMMSGKSDTEKVILNGSRKNFYSELSSFLDTTPYKRAQNFALKESKINLNNIIVTVIIPFFNGIGLLKKAVESVLSQTHKKLDIILVNDGSTENISEIKVLAKKYPEIQLLETYNGGPGHARNIGLRKARGEYIAFLDSDDKFMPEKIRNQLSQMMDKGSIFSHTSYKVTYPQGRKGVGIMDSGKFTGHVYPDIIGACPIATPTVMIHKIALLMGFEFPTDSSLMEDVRTWIWLAQKTPLLGIPSALSQITWRDGSAALNIKKNLEGIILLQENISQHPLHKLQLNDLAKLEKMHDALKSMHEFSLLHSDGDNFVNLDTIRLAFNDADYEIPNKTSEKPVFEVGTAKKTEASSQYVIYERHS